MVKATISKTVTVDVELSAADLGRLFIELDSDAQTQFFVAAADHARATWPRGERDLESQGYQIGLHLRTCECSSESARALVEHIASGMEPA